MARRRLPKAFRAAAIAALDVASVLPTAVCPPFLPDCEHRTQSRNESMSAVGGGDGSSAAAYQLAHGTGGVATVADQLLALFPRVRPSSERAASAADDAHFTAAFTVLYDGAADMAVEVAAMARRLGFVDPRRSSTKTSEGTENRRAAKAAVHFFAVTTGKNAAQQTCTADLAMVSHGGSFAVAKYEVAKLLAKRRIDAW
jgi:hypothetical protein